jgi:hypothetical protein
MPIRTTQEIFAANDAERRRRDAEDPLVQLYDHWKVDDLRALPDGDHLITRLDRNRWDKDTPIAVRDRYEPYWREREARLDAEHMARCQAAAAAARTESRPPAEGPPLDPEIAQGLADFLTELEGD